MAGWRGDWRSGRVDEVNEETKSEGRKGGKSNGDGGGEGDRGEERVEGVKTDEAEEWMRGMERQRAVDEN